MSKRTSTFIVLVLACISNLSLAAQDGPMLKASELATHPFQCRGLSVTITGLNGHQVFAAERKQSGRAHVKLAFENPSASFIAFSPQDLCLVGKDGIQMQPLFEINSVDDTTPMTLRIAPSARFSTEYVMTGRLRFPAKIYLGDTLVAQVTE